MKEYFNIMNIQEYTSGLSWFLYLLPFFIIGLIAVFVIYIHDKQSINKFVIIPFVILILFAIGYFALNNNELANLKEIYKNNNYNIIEGIVANFDPMPYAGHKKETFEVNGIKFSYSDYVSTIGYRQVFRKTRSHGGPINEGVYVKIYYIHDKKFNDNFIIGLWIKEK